MEHGFRIGSNFNSQLAVITMAVGFIPCSKIVYCHTCKFHVNCRKACCI